MVPFLNYTENRYGIRSEFVAQWTCAVDLNEKGDKAAILEYNC
jgi:hypothetical protein